MIMNNAWFIFFLIKLLNFFLQKVDYVADENGYRPTVTYLNP